MTPDGKFIVKIPLGLRGLTSQMFFFFLYQKLGYFNIKWRLWFEPLTSCTNTLTMISHDYHTPCSDCSPNLENLELSHLSPLNNPERSQQRPALCSYFSPETGALIFLSFIV